MWDKVAKARTKTFNPVGGPIAATSFNRDGKLLAYAVSYDWNKGRWQSGSQILPFLTHLLLNCVSGARTSDSINRQKLTSRCSVGYAHNSPEHPNKVMIHPVTDEEVKSKTTSLRR